VRTCTSTVLRSRLPKLEHVLLEMQSPGDPQQEDSREHGEVHLCREGGMEGSQSQRASGDVDQCHAACRHSEEPQEQPRHEQLEGKGEDEEPDVLAVDRVDNSEGLTVTPEEIGLPVACRCRGEEAASGHGDRDEGEESAASPDHPGVAARDGEIDSDEPGDRACDEDPELELRQQHSPEHVRLAQLVEPQGIGDGPRGRIRQQERHTEHQYDDRGATTRTQDERPV
jgi:hypothetical protein